MKKDSWGMTLIEILVGLAISVAILLVASSLIVNLLSLDRRNEEEQLMEQIKNDLHFELSTNIKWAKDVQLGINSITLDGTTYTLDQGRIYKNDTPITPESVTVDSFEFYDRSVSPDFVSLEITVSLKHKYTTISDSLRFVVSQRKTEIAID